jgi:hypothetical protein
MICEIMQQKPFNEEPSFLWEEPSLQLTAESQQNYLFFTDINKVSAESIVKLINFSYSKVCSCCSSNHKARAATAVSNISVHDRQKDLTGHVR